jgi:hypothetical protein
MTDRQLLEAAAKAAGIVGHWQEYANAPATFIGQYAEPTANGITGYHWNPLESDGDALRLANKLRMNIRLDDSGACVWAPKSARSFYSYFAEHESEDAATRRAIVRAAAAIGETA